jgi:hypothetical protein
MRNAIEKILSARIRYYISSGLALALLLAPVLTGTAQAQVLESNKREVQVAQAEGVASQERINNLDDDTAQLESEYKAVLQQLDTLRVYNQQLRDLISAQIAEIKITQRDIDRVTTIDREVVPLMLRMVEGIDQFVELDVPFLIKERRDRVANRCNGLTLAPRKSSGACLKPTRLKMNMAAPSKVCAALLIQMMVAS